MQQSDDMTERLMSLFQNREFELSEAGRFAADQDAMAADAERAKYREAATTWRRSLGAGDTVPGHDAYDYEAMARDEVWPKPDGAGRVPLSPRYWKPGRMVLAGHDLATGQRVLSRVPLEERVMSDMPEDEPGAENIEAILAQATPEDFAELSPVERRALDAWMESQGVQAPGVMVAQGGTQGTATDAPPVARVGRAGVPYQPPSMRDVTEPATALMDALAGALKGGVAQTLGLPGDLESLVRMLTGGEQVMPTTEDMNARLPAVVPPSTTDLVTGKNPREFSSDLGQAVGELGGLGKAPGMAAKGVAAGVRALAPTAKQMAERIAGKVGNSFRNYVVPYENAPDNLMGFPKDKPTKSFWDQKYSHVQFVRVKWADGMEIVDAVKGVNGPQAMERARRNWKDAAEIVPLTREDAFKADPELQTLMESMGQ